MTAPLVYYRDLVLVLLSKELKLRYKFTVLGYLWSVLHPLAFALVYYVVLVKLLGVRIDLLHLICGMFPWQWFQNSVTAANHTFLGNWMLLKKVRFPRSALVLAMVLNDLVHFVASIPVIVVFMLAYGLTPSWAWCYQLPLLIGIQFAFTVGLALAVATTNLFFRDLERLTSILTMLWFFGTPVLFGLKEIQAAGVPWLLDLNPMASAIISWRSAFLNGTLSAGLVAVAAGWALATLGLGILVYRRYEWRFAEVV
jgi:lipopolysaccharide transport system permease protein